MSFMRLSIPEFMLLLSFMRSYIKTFLYFNIIYVHSFDKIFFSLMSFTRLFHAF